MKKDFRRGKAGNTEFAAGGAGGEGDEDERFGAAGDYFQGGCGSPEFGGGGGGGYYGGGGGGFTNGTYGGGGAGSSFAEDSAHTVRVIGGRGTRPGSFGVKGSEPPLAALGDGYQVKEGVYAGQGAPANVDEVQNGYSGAVRIIERKYKRWYM